MRHLTRTEVMSLLRRSVLFEGLGADELDSLASNARPAEFRAGQVLVRRGDRGEAMIVVASGHVKVVTTSERGAELLINIIDRGGVLGELALLDGGERSADGIALDDVEVVTVPRAVFLRFLEAHPQASIRLLELLCAKLRRTTDLAEDSAFRDLPSRFYRGLMALAKLYGSQTDDGLLIAHKMVQKDLAASIGVSRESVNKQLRAWRIRGLVKTGTRYVLIKNPRALEREVKGR